MPVLNLKNIHKAYGPQVLLDGVSLTVRRSARVGLIGRNGEGKSTLLKIIGGMIEADSGEITLRRGARAAYLPQDPYFEPGQSVFSVVAEGLGEMAGLLREYDGALVALEKSHAEPDMKRVDRLQSELEVAGAWQYQAHISTAISKLGLEAHRDVGELSGGWLRRVALAQAVVSSPDILLLDEPTNHLDIGSIEWLEDFVAGFSGAVVFITHDRYFLDAVAEEIVELDRGHLRSFPCSYSEYLDKKAEQLAIEERGQRKFDRLLAQEERWIRQGIPARRTRNEGRVRNLEDLRRQRTERRLRSGDVELRVATGIKPGKMLIEAVKLSHAYGAQKIVDGLDLKIMAGDRVGLIGPNGIGKTTLLRLLLGELKPDDGRVRHGARLVPAFLKQMRQLDPDTTMSDVLLPQGGQYVYVAGVHARHVVSYLEDFLFDKERLRARVSALSGGERGRLMLAKLLLEPANLLVLDEPTNDLDIATLSVLEQALAKYEGTIIMVSHDRAFMDRTVSRVLALEGEGQVVPIEGGYSDYLAWKDRQGAQVQPEAKKRENPQSVPGKVVSKSVRKLAYKEQAELDSLPAGIETMEAEKSEIETRFCDAGYFQSDETGYRRDQERLAELEGLLDSAYSRWEELEEKSARLAVRE